MTHHSGKAPTLVTAKFSLCPVDFRDWTGLMTLLSEAFAGMEGRIDPPSSLKAMTADSLAQKATREALVLAEDGARLVGCGFGAVEGDALYLSKLAVSTQARRQGILRGMLDLLSARARSRGLAALTLQTRVELIENHRTFEALGFRRIAGTSHPGYDRITSWTYRKSL
jgi:ribosomal protein S18 acetylase RimI-like enzyme